MIFDIGLACTLILIVAGFTDKIPTTSRWKWLNSWPFKITLSIIVALVSYFYTAHKDAVVKADQIRTDSLNRMAQKKLEDSLHNDFKIQIIETSNSNIKTFTEALAGYHLEYVNGQVNIKSFIKDSIERENPGLTIETSSITHKVSSTKDSLTVTFPFQNTGNCPILLTFEVYEAFEANGTKGFISKFNATKEMQISQNMAYNYPTKIYFNVIPDKVMYLIKGVYSNISKKKKILINDVIVWQMKPDIIGSPVLVSQSDSIRKYFSKF